MYSGLVFSYKTIRDEIEPTILKIMHKSLDSWNDDIVFDAPHTLYKLENLSLRLILNGIAAVRTTPC